MTQINAVVGEGSRNVFIGGGLSNSTIITGNERKPKSSLLEKPYYYGGKRPELGASWAKFNPKTGITNAVLVVNDDEALDKVDITVGRIKQRYVDEKWEEEFGTIEWTTSEARTHWYLGKYGLRSDTYHISLADIVFYSTFYTLVDFMQYKGFLDFMK